MPYRSTVIRQAGRAVPRVIRPVGQATPATVVRNCQRLSWLTALYPPAKQPAGYRSALQVDRIAADAGHLRTVR